MYWTKICRSCKEIKVAPEFDQDSFSNDGLDIICIKCRDLELTLHPELAVAKSLGFSDEALKQLKEASDQRLDALVKRAKDLLDDIPKGED